MEANSSNTPDSSPKADWNLTLLLYYSFIADNKLYFPVLFSETSAPHIVHYKRGEKVRF